MLSHQINIFPCRVTYTDLEIDNEQIKNFVLNLQQKQKTRQVSNINGWQSNDIPLDTKEIQPLLTSILKCCNTYGEELNFKPQSTIVIDNIWANVNGYKDCNDLHTHPNVMMSGVYYVNCPTDCGAIQFRHPSTSMEYDWGWYKFEKFTEANCFEYWVPPIEKRLYIFPSWLSHKVQTNINKEEKRISLSFNAQLGLKK